MRKFFKPVLFGIVVVGLIASTAWSYENASGISAPAVSATTVSDQRYSTDLKELRTRFNKDKGKVRLLMLLSPT